MSSEGFCDCCGDRSPLRPNRRPHVPLLGDDDLLRMIDRDGEEAAHRYQQAMQHLADTKECPFCRSLDSTTYFIVRSGKERPLGLFGGGYQ